MESSLGIVANADTLDGVDSSAFMRSAMHVLAVQGPGVDVATRGTCDPNEACFQRFDCDANDVALGGGYGGMDVGTHVVSSRHSLGGAETWSVVWQNDSTVDQTDVVVWCLDLPPAR